MLAQLGAIALFVEAISCQRVVSIPFQKRAKTTPATLGKRAGFFSAPLNNYMPLSEYFATVQIGTPPQELELVIDTGSSDVWFFGKGACNVKSAGGACEGGEYDHTKSSTYLSVAPGDFRIQYETAGSGVKGDYIADNFAIGGITITNLTMAVATQANQTSTGIMGIGLDTDESIVEFTHEYYYNLPDEMYKQGKIAAKAYSLYLDDLSQSTGTVIFGGYDTAKFTGELKMLPLQNDSQSGIIDSFAVSWTSVSLTDSNGTFLLKDTVELPAAAILDSGTTLTYLPPDLFGLFEQAFGAENNQEIGAYIINCSITQLPGSIDYGFGGPNGPIISVPFAELATPIYDFSGAEATFKDGEPVCIFGLQPNQDGDPVLFGQTFLRSAYVMYDLQNLYAGLAPTVFDSTTSNILEYQGSGSQPSITTDTSGPTVTISSVVDNPGNPFTNVGTSITSGAYDNGDYDTSAFGVSSIPIAYTRSYPTGDVVPTSEPTSLLPITQAAIASGIGSSSARPTTGGPFSSGGGSLSNSAPTSPLPSATGSSAAGSTDSGVTASTSSSAKASGSSAATPLAVPVLHSSVAYVACAVLVASIIGGALII